VAEPADHRATVRRLVPGRGLWAGGGPAAGVVVWLRGMCDVATSQLAASGVGVSLMTDAGVLGVAAASDQLTESLGELQFTLAEGPCMDAFATYRPVLEPDLSGVPKGRWPAYTPAAASLGVRSVFAFPLQMGAARLGVLDVYRRTPGGLAPAALGLALAFADLTVEALLGAQDAVGHGTHARGRRAGGLDDVLDLHHVVYQAQGMTMVDLGVSLLDALARLRAHAFAEGRSLYDIAQDVVAGRLRLEPDAS
jgi:ANTAR domain